MKPQQQGSKFDMRINPVYQVDWQNAASGKRVSATKRRVRWRFGFSNAQAIAEGQTGTECRGEEHEVVLVWSLTSGKRLVIADGEEVHFSSGKRTDTRFETTWTIGGGHMLKVQAYAAPPLFPVPGFRQFDLLLDGCSYFDMPKIYELGTSRANKLAIRAAPHHHQQQAYNNYSLPPTEPRFDGYYERRRRSDEQRSIRSMPEESTESKDKEFALPPARRAESMPADVLSEPVLVEDHLATPATDVIETVQDEFSPVEAPEQPPCFELVSNQIMSAYAPTTTAAPAVLALANEPHTYHAPPQPQQQQTYYAPPPPVQTYAPPEQSYAPPEQQMYYQQTAPSYAPQQAAPMPVVTPDASSAAAFVEPLPAVQEESPPSPTPITPTMAPLSIQDIEARDQPPVSEMEQAVKTLVNLDDITETVETPETVKYQERKAENQPLQSKPLPPTKPEWHLGMKPALADIKEHAPPKHEPSKEIMRTHAFDPAAVSAGLMVVYGATSIPQANGFGAGMHYQQYQQPPPMLHPNQATAYAA